MTTWLTTVDCKEIHGSASETYNSLSGNPEFRVRLEVPWAQKSAAITELLGGPAYWPHSTVFNKVVVTGVSYTNDRSSYTTDGDAELISYQGNALLDVVYSPRNGKYGRDYQSYDVYWDDVLEPRTEFYPLEPKLFIWGGEDANVVPTDKIRPAQDELPNKIEPGQALYHTIEGWPRDFVSSIDFYVGTTHNAPYTSPILSFTFPADTLLLRSYTIHYGFTFASYRVGSGEPTQILKMVYEYKPGGWNKILRFDPIQQTRTKQYLRFANAPYDIVTIVQTNTHSNFLGSFLEY